MVARKRAKKKAPTEHLQAGIPQLDLPDLAAEKPEPEPVDEAVVVEDAALAEPESVDDDGDADDADDADDDDDAFDYDDAAETDFTTAALGRIELERGE